MIRTQLSFRVSAFIVSPAIIYFYRLEGSFASQRRLLSTDRINHDEKIRMKITLHLFDRFQVCTELVYALNIQ